MSVFKYLALAFVFLSAVRAQDDLRDQTARTLFFKTPGLGRGALIMGRGSSTITFEQYQPLWEPWQLTTNLPISNVGAIVRADASSSEFLVSGRDSQGQGWIVRLQATLGVPPTLALIEMRSYGAGLDPYSVAYNGVDGNLYVFDYGATRVLRAQWAPGLPLPSSFVHTLGSDVFPSLIAGQTLSPAVHINGGPLPGVDVYHLHEHLPMARITIQNGQWVAVPAGHGSLQAAPADVWLVEGRALVSSFGPITITGPSGPYELVDEDAASIVHSGSVPVANEPHVAVIGSELYAGHTHRFRQPGGAASSANLWPTVRYGNCVQIDQVQWTRGVLQAQQARVNSPEFSVAAGLRASVPVQFKPLTYLLVGVRDANGDDPVIVQGDLAFLFAPAAILGPLELEFKLNSLNDVSSFAMPIPDNPSLSGAVFLWQFVSNTPGGQVAASDVFGTRILPAQGSAAARGTRGSLPTLESVRAAWRALGADTDGGLPARSREVYDRIWLRIRHRLRR